ncbi:LysE family transporter [Fictibacillus sp. 5RED26]|uniref:LysE family translocator n=1 Tax=Fictibacillus sp. 5RED26 TaxID=2745876 RepID=UPI0018CD47E0|nr:LysE family transporter [Fictibacillus sp. 5RED26]MBH0155177.1 LysE family transporter [Fictibacillus sp. 5RED26]
MLLLKSIILGFSISAPVGPIGLLCIQRTLSQGKSAGFLTGFGAVTANIVYASIAVLGFSVSSLLIQYEMLLKILGTIFLLYLGVKTFLKKVPNQAAQLAGESKLMMFFSTFFLMITNPVTILNFTAMFAGLGFGESQMSLQIGMFLISGVFIGATCWWMFLSIVVSLLTKSIQPHLATINKGAGLLIIGLALANILA